MAQLWDSHVNSKFYGQDGSFEDNREKITYKSGRTIYHLKNSTPKKTHAVNIRVQDYTRVNGKTEFEWFLYWYEETIKSGTLFFYLTDFETQTETKQYCLAAEPKWTGQKYKEISLQINEV